MRQPTRIPLKRGIVQSGDYLQTWLDNSYKEPFFTDAKRDILVDLCDETAVPIVRWQVQGALPIKVDAPTFDANSNEVAIETMEFTAHGLTVDYNP
jgi:phage tail-like protein